MRVSLDFESRSTVDLSDTGVYVYAAHPDTEFWCLCYAIDDGPVGRWVPGEPFPADLAAAIAAGAECRAWNANFERVMWHAIGVPRHGFPVVPLEQWRCTMAEALAMALPANLGQAAVVLGVTEQKDMAGKDLMMRMARPRRMEGDVPVWWDEPDRLTRLYAYCAQDVETERAIIPCLRRLSDAELAVYRLDQRMNDRGIGVDLALVEGLEALAAEGVRRANAALTRTTGGAVGGVTNHGKLLQWVRAQGIDTDSLDKAAVAQLLAGDLPDAVRTALTIRAEAGRSSTAKLRTMREYAGADARLRGLLFYHGATTGRWAGRGVQPHNFPRGDVADPDAYLALALAGDYDALDLHAPPMAVASSLLRACLVAAPGHVLVAADYSAIEARVLNWLAGQEDIVRLFASGADVYAHNAAKLYGIPLAEVQKFPHRQTGKFQELGCGYGMGAKKAVDAARDVYGLEIDADRAKAIVTAYRESHPQVVDFWYATERACLAAVEHPGTVQRFGADGRLKAIKAGAYLYVILPSGRPLCYPSPRIVQAETPWSKQAREAVAAARETIAAANAEYGTDIPLPELPPVETKPSLEFATLGMNRQWTRERTYGGKLVENITQAVARDLMAEAMLRAEDAGFPPVLTVHDEIVSEIVDDLEWDDDPQDWVRAFEHVLTELPDWAAGCPVAAEGWMGPRYKK